MAETAYNRWMQEEGIPVVTGYGVPDARAIERKTWARTGGKGAFINLIGMEGFTGMYVGEIAPRGALHPQKHLCQQLIYILEGRGAAEVWLPGDDNNKTCFEWGKGAFFAIPLNCHYQLFNGGDEPVIYLGVNDAPMMLDIFHDNDFIFNNPYRFTKRFTPSPEYFDAGAGKRIDDYYTTGTLWETNFIADIREAFIDARERKGPGVKVTGINIAENSLVGHLTEWPVGRYHKAHYHAGGAIILGLLSQGYALMWPMESGVRPYQNNMADTVVRMEFAEGALYCPPTKWFHQHFNTGNEPAREAAFRFSAGGKYPVGFRRGISPPVQGRSGVMTGMREGGTVVEYEDEDPQIRQDFEATLKKSGLTCQMPPVVYR